jgi:hypothetical protein
MDPAALRCVRQANARLERALGDIGEALAGRREFTPEDVRAIAAPVQAMAAVVSQAELLRAAHPALRAELDRYAGNLAAMQQAFDRVRCVLLARRAQMAARRGHLETVRRWAATWQQTR